MWALVRGGGAVGWSEGGMRMGRRRVSAASYVNTVVFQQSAAAMCCLMCLPWVNRAANAMAVRPARRSGAGGQLERMLCNIDE